MKTHYGALNSHAMHAGRAHLLHSSIEKVYYFLVRRSKRENNGNNNKQQQKHKDDEMGFKNQRLSRIQKCKEKCD